MPTRWQHANDLSTISCLTGLNAIAVSATMTYSVSVTARYIAVISSAAALDLCEVEIYAVADDDYTTQSASEDSTTQSASDHFSVDGKWNNFIPLFNWSTLVCFV